MAFLFAVWGVLSFAVGVFLLLAPNGQYLAVAAILLLMATVSVGLCLLLDELRAIRGRIQLLSDEAPAQKAS